MSGNKASPTPPCNEFMGEEKGDVEKQTIFKKINTYIISTGYGLCEK